MQFVAWRLFYVRWNFEYCMQFVAWRLFFVLLAVLVVDQWLCMVVIMLLLWCLGTPMDTECVGYRWLYRWLLIVQVVPFHKGGKNVRDRVPSLELNYSCLSRNTFRENKTFRVFEKCLVMIYFVWTNLISWASEWLWVQLGLGSLLWLFVHQLVSVTSSVCSSFHLTSIPCPPFCFTSILVHHSSFTHLVLFCFVVDVCFGWCGMGGNTHATLSLHLVVGFTFMWEAETTGLDLWFARISLVLCAWSFPELVPWESPMHGESVCCGRV